MMYRKIEHIVEHHLLQDKDRILVVDGARQVGKSYIIREVGKRLFSNYIELNMEEDKLGKQYFSEARSVEDFYMVLGMIAGDKLGSRDSTLVFIDEIQAYSHLLTLLKFLNEDKRFTFVASDSMLGLALSKTTSIPMGSIHIERMYPMDFEEFMIANDVAKMSISSMRQAFKERRSLPEPIHLRVMDLFKKYLLVGGLPLAVKRFIASQNIHEVRSVHSDIRDLYGVDASKYENENGRKLKIKRILQMIPSSLENKKKRIVFKDIEGISWKRSESYIDEFDYLISSGVALDVKAISQPTYPLIANSGKNLIKLYLNDIGLLSGVYYK